MQSIRWQAIDDLCRLTSRSWRFPKTIKAAPISRSGFLILTARIRPVNSRRPAVAPDFFHPPAASQWKREHTPPACGFRCPAENCVGQTIPSVKELNCGLKVQARRLNSHAGRVRSRFHFCFRLFDFDRENQAGKFTVTGGCAGIFSSASRFTSSHAVNDR